MRDVLRTRVCDLLGIEYPILQSGMANVAGPELVAEVSRAGGHPVYRLHYVADEGYRDSLTLTWLEEQQAIRVGSSAEMWTRSAER